MYGLGSYALAGINTSTWTVNQSQLRAMTADGISTHLGHIDYPTGINTFAQLTADQQAGIIQSVQQQQHTYGFTFVYPILYGNPLYDASAVVTSADGPYHGETLLQLIAEDIQCDRQYPNPCTSPYSVWTANGNGSVSDVTPSGAVAATTATSGGGTALAIDHSGNVWSLNQSSSTVSEFSKTGALLQTGTVVGGLNVPKALAIDGAGLVWIANGDGTVSELSAPNTAVSSTAFQVGASSPTSLNIDGAGNLWLTNTGDNSVTEVFGAAALTPMTIVSGVVNGSLGSKP